jgi:hypothetical protein
MECIWDELSGNQSGHFVLEKPRRQRGFQADKNRAEGAEEIIEKMPEIQDR